MNKSHVDANPGGTTTRELPTARRFAGIRQQQQQQDILLLWNAEKKIERKKMPDCVAPSREDVVSTLDFFFGDPEPEELKDYSENHAANTL